MHPRTTTIPALLLLATSVTLHAQWQIQQSDTTSSLRGITTAGDGIAWASGTEGTVLHTTDGGAHWQRCPTPPGAGHLDFRGIQAFGAQTAIVMSSGKGDLSRLYKTTDACQTWRLLFTNPDTPGDGFFDTLLFLDRDLGMVFGDPAHGTLRNPVEGAYFTFRIRLTNDGGATWMPITDPERPSPGHNLMPIATEGLFAASNSSAAVRDGWLWIGTGGGRVLRRRLYEPGHRSWLGQGGGICAGAMDPTSHKCGLPWIDWTNTDTPLSTSSPTGGIFSLTFRLETIGIAVGGDFQDSAKGTKTAAYTLDAGTSWHAAMTPPHGYRSSVAYDPTHKSWITVGPNGTDISTDDGRNWKPLKPNPAAGDPEDADRNWNALALPFVVGPHGRIGKLRPEALTSAPRLKTVSPP